MGRSQETFSKKEKEKKKLKKRQDKEQKKEERLANSSKGKDLDVDEMMAYVDDNGNITDTPPDPKKKRIVKQEDIQIGVTRQEDLDPADLIRKGTITFFNTSKGYGFIRDHDSQESIFVHQNSLTTTVKENDKVTFEVEKGLKGLNAINVKLID